MKSILKAKENKEMFFFFSGTKDKHKEQSVSSVPLNIHWVKYLCALLDWPHVLSPWAPACYMSGLEAHSWPLFMLLILTVWYCADDTTGICTDQDLMSIFAWHFWTLPAQECRGIPANPEHKVCMGAQEDARLSLNFATQGISKLLSL